MNINFKKDNLISTLHTKLEKTKKLSNPSIFQNLILDSKATLREQPWRKEFVRSKTLYVSHHDQKPQKVP